MLFVRRLFLVCLASLTTLSNTLVGPNYTFEDYVRDFRRSYAPSEVHERQVAVENALRRIAAHNALPGGLWKAGVNEFTDWTHRELHMLRGYDKVTGSGHFGSLRGALQLRESTSLPSRFDWREKGVVSAVKEQHTCQGCWAFAAVEAVESALAIAGEPLTELSVEELISCTPNVEHCGGSGGCGGGTAEQAFNFSVRHGLTTAAAYPYKHYPFSSHVCDQRHVRTPRAAVQGFVRLPPNDGRMLLTALVQEGPIAVTVAATSWMLYDSGIFDGELGMGCGTDLNHQVSLVGYGGENGTNYWLLRNSYGSKWGEQGYMRMLRAAPGEKEVCGVDSQPTDGYCGQEGWCACPKSITVCGMCGILADSSYPTGVRRFADLESGTVLAV